MTTIVLVSHSADIAKGTKDLLEQMVNNVDIKAHGGTEDGAIGTSFDEIQKMINHIEDDALCFYDLGSSEMNLDMAIEMYEGQYQIAKINAPLVEGSFTAAVKLSTGGNMKEAIEEVNNTHFSSET
ncbi:MULTISPECIES: dihydroxyacetone kinase phosphoryl donor subunit DhaM [Staphylococcus]|uniref:dihydroxyacetone kinase phosphoryl donor subunit DhaM n=1 Tax=Staphylococcus TaxID=1279 RepID=UPI0008A8429B|nr:MULTISPECIES: dihydroxyacetone kinase phosphoryl donor subunit DhaM [Staphylococcus]MBU5271717.1 PTS-dependent dihydroxyacetone kinase phosphotransferase subunit DhaM [Staphylococcus caprae]MBX5319077.1 PTS-dependent dihydroxyacetone kinase phosphotransferase subunit DhaM [Staphylococcus caprae]MDI9231336.1 dihydroxyacetone kinase phosphoryl donor subunit DhaM [Staphylococcus caprae]MDK6296645.1 dihydroxyacetone kinase phosphoryl donor subunit DhaM [Staphylococcus caprae]MDK7232921.1 dihydr